MNSSTGNHLFDLLTDAQMRDQNMAAVNSQDLFTTGPSRKESAAAVFARPADKGPPTFQQTRKPKTEVDAEFGFNEVKFHYDVYDHPGHKLKLEKDVNKVFARVRNGTAMIVSETRSIVPEGGFQILFIWAELTPESAGVTLPEGASDLKEDDEEEHTYGPDRGFNQPDPLMAMVGMEDEDDY